MEAAGDDPVDVCVAHLANPERAEQLAERLAERLADNLGGREVVVHRARRGARRPRRPGHGGRAAWRRSSEAVVHRSGPGRWRGPSRLPSVAGMRRPAPDRERARGGGGPAAGAASAELAGVRGRRRATTSTHTRVRPAREPDARRPAAVPAVPVARPARRPRRGLTLGAAQLAVVGARWCWPALAVAAWWLLGGAAARRSSRRRRRGRPVTSPASSTWPRRPAAHRRSRRRRRLGAVDVAGKVRRRASPCSPPASRVVDALEAAGGARRGVDLTGLNLARLLVDGEQIVVGRGRRRPGSPPAVTGGDLSASRRWSTSTPPTRRARDAARRRPGDGAGDPGLAHRARRLHRGRGAARGRRDRRGDAGRDRAVRDAMSGCACPTCALPLLGLAAWAGRSLVRLGCRPASWPARWAWSAVVAARGARGAAPAARPSPRCAWWPVAAGVGAVALAARRPVRDGPVALAARAARRGDADRHGHAPTRAGSPGVR